MGKKEERKSEKERGSDKWVRERDIKSDKERWEEIRMERERERQAGKKI